ncbi:TetR family transcriptional regulator [Enterococcus sp. JM4C]|uniref:TetR family transcriptional regulator n=1 Tax=Candidatus Enterococcus huntleyi TaxID=1857217 RepID=UPI00137B1A7B|nr:TetR family transcriptional regulator [Enterococcus sp. JM4C]KAF1296694.1 TetR family transcriptional regulator [Enterococcus sp. JM4C]
MEAKLSKEKIIQTAFHLLEEKENLSWLSMRHIASALDVKAPALYWYFKNKQMLLQAMAETMESHLIVPEIQGIWKKDILAYMESYFDLYTQFPCGIELEIQTVPAYPSRLEHIDTMIQIIRSGGVPLAQSHLAVSSFQNLLIGFMMDYKEEAHLRQEIVDGNQSLLEHIHFMRNYAEENQLVNIQQGMQTRKERSLKSEYLESIAIYLDGLDTHFCQQHD